MNNYFLSRFQLCSIIYIYALINCAPIKSMEDAIETAKDFAKGFSVGIIATTPLIFRIDECKTYEYDLPAKGRDMIFASIVYRSNPANKAARIGAYTGLCCGMCYAYVSYQSNLLTKTKTE